MDLLGQTVRHKLFGKGVITDLCQDRLTVRFGESQRCFMYPDAIPRFLTLEDSAIQDRIEDINNRREEKLERERHRQEEKDKYRRRLLNMKIPPRCQAAYNLPRDWDPASRLLPTGSYLSGYMKGQPRLPSNIQPNSALLLTSCQGSEQERRIDGIAMVDIHFWGDECKDGQIVLHPDMLIMLPEEDRALFWPCLEDKAVPASWGRIPFRYVQNSIMEGIISDMLRNSKDKPWQEKALALDEYYSKLNRVPSHKPIDI